MTLSKQSIENLLDLVEIKLSCIEVIDREDARELKHLRNCRDELLGIQASTHARQRTQERGTVVALHH